MNPNRKSVIIPSFILKGESKNTNRDAAYLFVNFLFSITSIFKFIHINVCSKFINKFLKNNYSLKIPTNPFEFQPFTLEEVTKGFSTLTPGSSMGAIGIETIILKKLLPLLVSYLIVV